MKSFLGKVSNSPVRGYNRRIDVYQVKKNTLNLVDFVDVNTASYKGDESTVLDCLLLNKLITKKAYESVRGYYTFSMRENYGISIQVI